MPRSGEPSRTPDLLQGRRTAMACGQAGLRHRNPIYVLSAEVGRQQNAMRFVSSCARLPGTESEKAFVIQFKEVIDTNKNCKMSKRRSGL